MNFFAGMGIFFVFILAIFTIFIIVTSLIDAIAKRTKEFNRGLDSENKDLRKEIKELKEGRKKTTISAYR